jgi:hypothetical protein
MNKYFYIKIKIGGSDFYLRSVTWQKNFEPCFEPTFVTNIDLAGLFFEDAIKKVIAIYPDAKILTTCKIKNKLELIEVQKQQFTR